MYDMIISVSGSSTLKRMGAESAGRVFGSMERLRIRPERYLRPLLTDPSYRFRTDEAYVYLDISKDHIIVLRVVSRGPASPGV